MSTVFADFIEDEPEGVAWHTAAETRRLLSLMSPLNLQKVEDAKRSGRRMVGGIYKRTRANDNGDRQQRAEIRFDDVAGCLRTPVGGSSRQSIMIVEGRRIRSRLLSPREAARLMGLPETYKLPTNYNEAYHLAGDGVAVPVVSFLSSHLLEPLLAAGAATDQRSRVKTMPTSTFADNLSLPIHRWFRYSAGFSATWARSLIEQEKAKGRRTVLDPFAGSGTTIIEGEGAGLCSIGIEAHPFVARIARAKLQWRSNAPAFRKFAHGVLERAIGHGSEDQAKRPAQALEPMFPA